MIADRTSISVKKAKTKNDDLASGMTCAIAYLGNQTTAKSVDCD